MTNRGCSLALAGIAFLAASPASASFHLMKIEQVIGGVGIDTSQQAIQLRLRAAGQNVLSAGARLVARDAAGANPVVLITFASNVANGGQGARVLVVSPAFASAQPAIPADFTMTSTIPVSYLAAGRLTFEDTGGTVYWSLAWGGASYTGSHLGTTFNDADGNFGPAFGSALPWQTTQALRFSVPDPTGAVSSSTNATDYSVTAGAAVFTNNAGASGTVILPPEADLSITKSDGDDAAIWGQPLGYTLVVSNAGPAGASGAIVTDAFPAGLSGVSWTCLASGGSACPANGAGNISAAIVLAVGGTATFTATGTVVVGAPGLVNTATVTAPAGVVDPNPGNNTATETTPLAPTDYHPLAPCRLVDTRSSPGPGGGPALAANETRFFPVANRCGIPSDTRAVALNLTVVQPTAAGNLRLFPAGDSVPNASAINFGANQVRGNNAIIPLGSGGQIAVRYVIAPVSGSAHFVLDAFGYFR